MTFVANPGRQVVMRAIGKAWDNGYANVDCAIDFTVIEFRVDLEAATNAFLFNLDFARALWGTQPVEWRIGGYQLLDPDGNVVKTPAYLFHLQQLAIAPDKVAYLKKHAGLSGV